jgi:hypothetical protein
MGAAAVLAMAALGAGAFARGATPPRRSSSAPARSSSAHAQFAARADAVCSEAARRTSRLRTPSSPSQYAPFLERVEALLTTAERELQGIPAPARSRSAYARFLATVSSELARIGHARAYLRAGEVRRAERALRELDPEKAAAEAVALGLPVCAHAIEASVG